MKDLIKSVFIYGFASVMAKFIGVFLMPIYTRVFSPAEYGAVAMCMLFVAIANMFGNLNIHSGVARDYYEAKNIEERRRLISTGFWHIAVFSFVVMIISYVFASEIASKFLGVSEYLNAFKVSLLLIPLASFFSFFTIMMRLKKKPWLFTLVIGCQLLNQIAVSLVTILIFKWGIVGIFWGQISGSSIAIMLLIYILRRNLILSVDFATIKKILAYSVPTLPAILGAWINESLNRFLLLKYLSLDSVGHYTVALKVTSVFILFNVAFRNAWGPHFLENLKKHNHKEEFVRIYKLLLLILSFFVISITLFSKTMVKPH